MIAMEINDLPAIGNKILRYRNLSKQIFDSNRQRKDPTDSSFVEELKAADHAVAQGTRFRTLTYFFM